MKSSIFGSLLAFLLIVGDLSASQGAIITIPKTGTNLLLKLIFLIDQAHGIDLDADKYNSPKRKNGPNWLHAWKASNSDENTIGPTDEKIKWIQQNDIRVIIVVRDPRAFLYAIAKKDSTGMADLKDLDFLIENPIERLNGMTGQTCFSRYPDLNALYKEYLSWRDYPFTYTTYFESLVGPMGGGHRSLQLREILNIAKHINKPITSEQAKKIAGKLFGGTDTFQSGQIDGWITGFSDNQKQTFYRKYKILLHWLGYPLNNPYRP